MIADPKEVRRGTRHVLTPEQQCAIATRARALVAELADHPEVRAQLGGKRRTNAVDRVVLAAARVPAVRPLLTEVERLWWDLAMSEHRVARREARRFAGRLPEEDLRQEGCHGLLKAARRFDPGRGVKFAHHAGWWVRAQIQRVLGSERPVTTSPNTTAALCRVLRLEAHGWTRARAAEAVGLSARRLEAVIAADHVISTSAPVVGSEGLVVEDMLPAEPWDADGDLDQHQGRVSLLAAIDALPARERQVIRQRMEGATLDAIGVDLGLSRERVRQIETNAHALVRAAVTP